MPLFIIVSGFFYRNESFKITLKKVFLKLILPYIVGTIIVDLIMNVSTYGLGETLLIWIKQIGFSYSYMKNIMIDNIISLGVLWFFPLLAGIKLLFCINKKVSKDNDYIMTALILLETYIGYLLGIKGYWLPFSFDITLNCMLFFFIGYICKKYNILDYILKNWKIIIIITIIWIIGIKFNSIEIATRSYPNGLWSSVIAICGTFVIFKISQIIANKTKYLSKLLSWYGRNSMYILLFHYVEMQLIQYDRINIENSMLRKSIISILKIAIATCGTIILLKIIDLDKLIKSKIKGE